MKRNLAIKGLIMLLLFSFTVLGSNEILDKISLALKSGNSKELAKYFDNNIELTILRENGAYSKVQAEQVLKNFFSNNPPKSFKLIHKGSSNKGSQYGIGNLTTSKGTYRTYFYFKQKGEVFKIQELRIEEE